MINLAKKLATKPFDGYLQVVKIANGEIKKLNNIKYENIDEIKNYRKEKDIYYTPNTSYNGKRGVENLKNLRELYLDFDLHKNLKKEDLKAEINFIIAEVWFKAYIGEIPRPSKAIITGRGVHIYWDLEPSSYGALSTWQELEDFLYNKLKYLGADRQATDAARILRLPNTINSKNNEECYIYVCENNIYSMYELREKYLQWSNKHKKNYVKKESQKRKSNKINLFNSYTLHLGRAEDLVRLVKLRKGNVVGYRNFILHCYAYWMGIYNRDTEVLKDLVYKLNNSFKEHMRNSEVDKVLRCIPKAISKFLEYEQGLRTGQAKRVSKGMRERWLLV
ncbi:DNA-binding response regulator [Clostridium thermobutyricum]|uniref:DNA-binding response regulator n=1 Tax=Clostridium thermobutyricum TaxID=29372 RepID=UPI002943CF77|nr:DNA-binding response regulator [Clostridium thermobutyricum]